MIACSNCGKRVSSPDGSVIRAWIECPECIEAAKRLVDQHNAEMKVRCIIIGVTCFLIGFLSGAAFVSIISGG